LAVCLAFLIAVEEGYPPKHLFQCKGMFLSEREICTRACFSTVVQKSVMVIFNYG